MSTDHPKILAFDGTPAWLLPRGERKAKPPPNQASTADHLYRRLWANSQRLHHPDAWVNIRTRELAYADPQNDNYVALRVGDTLHYSQVLRMPFVTHDMIYVGLGCVVGLARFSKYYEDQAAMEIERLDKIKVKGKCISVDRDGGRSSLSRFDIATRALRSLGSYNYDAFRFNCQHAYERLLGNSWFSLGLIRMITLVLLGIILIAIGMAFGMYHLWKWSNKPLLQARPNPLAGALQGL